MVVVGWISSSRARATGALYPTSLQVSNESLSLTFIAVFNEFVEMFQRIATSEGEPIFNPVPLLGAGSSATSMDDLITCELFVRKTSSALLSPH
ncbi:hypothetical protein CsSME_00044500 [Camellia sinensis var. sinensis]